MSTGEDRGENKDFDRLWTNFTRLACRFEKAIIDLDQGGMVGKSRSAGMNSTDEKQSEKETTPRGSSEVKRLLAEYIADLRAIIDKLRRKLN